MAKKNMRNEFEFMASVLDALGVEYEEADIKVRERWRSKVLDGWGVDYVADDLKEYERWRSKCIEGLSNGGGGGGSSSCPMKLIHVTIYGANYVEPNNSKSAPNLRATPGGAIYFSGAKTFSEDEPDVQAPINGIAQTNSDDWVSYGEVGSLLSDGKKVITMIIFKGTSIHLGLSQRNLTVVSGDAVILDNGIAEISGDCVLREAEYMTGDGA